jgi:hypothetical protein
VRFAAVRLAQELDRVCLSKSSIRHCLHEEFGLDDGEVDEVLAELSRQRAAIIDPRSGLPQPRWSPPR